MAGKETIPSAKPVSSSSSSPSSSSSITNLQYGYNSSLQITSHKLNGKNFLHWSQSVLMVLHGRGKIGYINGEIRKPSVGDADYAAWELNNSIVMAWLVNSMELNISHTYLLYKTAKAIWDAVKEYYSDFENASQIFKIKMQLKEMRQGKLDVTSYYNSLKILWPELDMFYEIDWGDVDEHVKFKAHLDKKRLYEFLAGLDRELDEV